jgi:hypothetical protein
VEDSRGFESMAPDEVEIADERREGSSLRIRLNDMEVGEVGSVMFEGQFSAEFQRLKDLGRVRNRTRSNGYVHFCLVPSFDISFCSIRFFRWHTPSYSHCVAFHCGDKGLSALNIHRRWTTQNVATLDSGPYASTTFNNGNKHLPSGNTFLMALPAT